MVLAHVSEQRAPRAADLRALARADAGAFTQAVNYPVAARLGVLAHRRNARPVHLTVANLLLGLAASVGVIAWAAHPRAHVVVGLLAGLIWQAAYCCDCADGQLARLTGTATPAGARLDILCDIAVQVSLVAAVVTVATAARPGVPPWFVAVFAGSWMVNLVTAGLAKEGANASLITSTSRAVRLLKLARDYGFMLTLITAVLTVRPAAMVGVMVFFSLVNCGFLLASIARSARGTRLADRARAHEVRELP